MASEYINNKEFEKNIVKFQNGKTVLARYKLLIDEAKDTIARKSIRENNTSQNTLDLQNYISKVALISIEHEQVKTDLANAFRILAENLCRYFKFHSFEADDAIQDGVMIGFDKIDKFNPKRGHAFSYFTTITANSLRQLHRTSKNFTDFKHKYYTYQTDTQQKSIIKNGKDVILFEG